LAEAHIDESGQVRLRLGQGRVRTLLLLPGHGDDPAGLRGEQ
jgi:hypothetical protein